MSAASRKLARPLPRFGEGVAPRTLEPVSPTRWRGECGCAVGPFSSHEVAEIFATMAAARGRCPRARLQLFACRDAWYVEVRPADATTGAAAQASVSSR